MKNLEKAERKKAIDIANTLVEEGYKEGQAIPIATDQAKQWYSNASEKERDDYLAEGNVTEHDQRYSSNPALLDENEMVIKHDNGWAVQSRKAKKAAKVFEQKDEAITYAREIAQNKQTKLEIYGQDGELQRTDDYSG